MIAKRVDATYEPGRRSDAWRKIKVEARQEFVVGGWTEPRHSREHLGALLLGYYDPGGRLVYAGHTGGGFTSASLRDMAKRLAPLERAASPFTTTPVTNERAHWVTPRVVVEVKFTEWTDGGKLRHPIFKGVRDDKDARDVVRESVTPGAAPAREPSNAAASPKRVALRRPAKVRARVVPATARKLTPRRAAPDGLVRRGRVTASPDVVAQLEQIEADGGDGVLDFGAGQTLEVSNLGKAFFPRPRRTKGALMRYYARVAPVLLPAIANRPLVLRRFPNGIDGQSFYQQNAPDHVPPGVRVEAIPDDDGSIDRRFVGGDLLTLCYTVQLGALSVDPWHGRVGALDQADYSIIDLDPGPRAPFRRVIEVARMVREELDLLGLHAALKTSGASGLHIVLPLASGTPHDAARLVAELVASRVAEHHPRRATVVRGVRDRPTGTVYVDYLQNIPGKTVASVYSARARPVATVSTPLAWSELTDDLDPRSFTIDNVPERIEQVGDLWATAMAKPNRLDVLGTKQRKTGRRNA